jgi:hypothetical protein
MESVKKYHVGDSGLVEGEALGRITVVLGADYDAAVMRIGSMACANRQMDEELEIARDDLLIFKSGLSALGEATKKLVVFARSSGGTAGPDQGLMDACAGVESVITLAGVARAIDEFERIQAENLALQQRLTVQDQRVDELGTQVHSLEQRRQAEQQSGMAAERRVESLCAFANEMVSAAFEGGSLDGSDIQDIAVMHGVLRIETREDECGEGCACREYGFPAECYRRTELIALKPTAEAVSHDQ